MPPICIDLDGTLIFTDILYEQMVLLIKYRPWMVIFFPFWLFHGKNHFKQKIASQVELAIEHLPYNTALITWLKEQKAKGRQLVLVTASHFSIAQRIANHLNIFDEVLATDKDCNLRGKNKRAKLIEKYGEKQFDYIGNEKSDVPVWDAANEAMICRRKNTIPSYASHLSHLKLFAAGEKPGFTTLLKTLRVHQYAKNLLLFVPLLLGHEYQQAQMLSLLLGFASFSLLASSVYIFNDLFDLEADRNHKTKCKRSFANGVLSIRTGFVLTAILLAASMMLASFLPLHFQLILAAYYLLTVSYSFYFKRIPLVDVFLLSALYTIRILAGMALAHQSYSH